MRSLANRRAGKNMEVGQIVSEPGPPSRYCDAIIHHKLSTQGQFAPNGRPANWLPLPAHAASLCTSSSSFPSPARSSHLYTHARILRCIYDVRANEDSMPSANKRTLERNYHPGDGLKRIDSTTSTSLSTTVRLRWTLCRNYPVAQTGNFNCRNGKVMLIRHIRVAAPREVCMSINFAARCGNFDCRYLNSGNL